ncbi:MAG: hypothetical protein HAW62_05225 [Endozoicomonadaceae bacterium]|nr:hypothetical protein [Endozoicomonadaceae bacterium]
MDNLTALSIISNTSYIDDIENTTNTSRDDNPKSLEEEPISLPWFVVATVICTSLIYPIFAACIQKPNIKKTPLRLRGNEKLENVDDLFRQAQSQTQKKQKESCVQIATAMHQKKKYMEWGNQSNWTGYIMATVATSIMTFSISNPALVIMASAIGASASIIFQYLQCVVYFYCTTASGDIIPLSTQLEATLYTTQNYPEREELSKKLILLEELMQEIIQNTNTIVTNCTTLQTDIDTTINTRIQIENIAQLQDKVQELKEQIKDIEEYQKKLNSQKITSSLDSQTELSDKLLSLYQTIKEQRQTTQVLLEQANKNCQKKLDDLKEHLTSSLEIINETPETGKKEQKTQESLLTNQTSCEKQLNKTIDETREICHQYEMTLEKLQKENNEYMEEMAALTDHLRKNIIQNSEDMQQSRFKITQNIPKIIQHYIRST